MVQNSFMRFSIFIIKMVQDCLCLSSSPCIGFKELKAMKIPNAIRENYYLASDSYKHKLCFHSLLSEVGKSVEFRA